MQADDKAVRSQGCSSVRLSFTVPKEHHAELLRLAAKNKVSVAWVIRAAVERYVADEGPLLFQGR